ncbi:DUF3320 domain-containing protein [Hymenobacter sp. BT175]|uniref:DUF3320 domain-containing protein n=1 Tax=Hymenobacter translucens TaxID=2886507 RepID=UPI001D0EE2BF|nr:DUF3320 domain-containing protein [Hymenobacter translucens]MCC2545834.1 DUF3320 domain-containing protein [Hymenobacter translucens]
MSATASAFPDPALAARLEASRQELLDLGLRNPLLHYRPSRTYGLSIGASNAEAVYNRLVRQGKPMSFRPAPSASALTSEENEGDPASGSAGQLHTAELSDQLERRLLNTYYAARTSLEEQGVNILYLALGRLTWYEAADSPDARQAPLVLVPVLLERGTVAERFRLRYSGAEVEVNLSLQVRLKASFGLLLPEPDDELPLTSYYAAVTKAVAGFPRWQVEAESVELGLFSFGKLLLYRDLDPAGWPARRGPLDHPVIQALLGPDTGFQDPAPTVDDDAFLDTESPTAELHQVLDADSSQLLALLAVHEGRNLIIQGPPGTGKSQTIANLLAEAIGSGKKVLFVAEKMAALEVVKRRLDALGLGAACLELHSHKASKKALHHDLRQTLDLGRPVAEAATDDHVAQLPGYRQLLNDYALAVNTPLGRSRRTAQQVMGELLHLRGEAGASVLPRISFARLSSWTDADAARAEAQAVRLQAMLQKVGSPHNLLFWGSELLRLLPAEEAILRSLLPEAGAAVAALQAAARELAEHLSLPIPADRAAAEALLPTARHVQLAPPLTAAAVADPGWEQQLSSLGEALIAGTAYSQLHQQYDAVLLPEAWEQDLSAERTILLTTGQKWWRHLHAGYRRARLRLQHVWRAPLPEDLLAVVPVLDAVQMARRHARTVAGAAPYAAALLGPAWLGLRSDWPALRRLVDYLTLTHQRIARRELPAALLNHLATVVPDAVASPLSALEAALARHRRSLQALVDALQLNEARRFGPAGRLQFQSFADQLTVLAAWAADLPALGLVTEWNNVATAVRAAQVPELLPVAESWPAAAEQLLAAVRHTWLEYLLQLAHNQFPALRQFERASHEAAISQFRRADQSLLHHNRIRALRRHYEQLPREGAGGQMLVVRNELAKKSRHLPLRRLMQQAGRAVQAIKPVFMMSPLSVAGYLPPGSVAFDLVVFDEASQVKPVDALGAIARGRQLVVVGDSRQLPPTSFFDSLTGTGEAADEENVTADLPSILELARARQMPERWLRWHYRSQHESLIAPSNELFYDGKLVVFPSPGGQEERGLFYHHLPDAFYERGTTRTNPQEAAAVADAVLEHARTRSHLTLGVVAFSAAQRQAIQDALEIRRQQQAATESFFNRHPVEPFFVKNLENVQGDERDVMLISLGYGRSRDGHLAMSFGPLNAEGGERRLNVLITRARQRCDVFTNLTAADLDLSRTPARGVAALKAFLAFAQPGQGELAAHKNENRDELSFEAVVGQALSEQGYELHHRVGSTSFHLDLAVVDPNRPGQYLLGIESDGTMYQRARSARDRNRLRQEVLEALGWRLHRVWSTDWFRNPKRAADQAVAAIEHARRAGRQSAAEEAKTAAAALTGSGGVERESGPPPALSEPYPMARLPAAIRLQKLHRQPVGRLAVWVTEVVRVESPVHVEEVTRRLAQAAGAGQVGSRIRAGVAAAIRLAVSLGSIRQEEDFLWLPGSVVAPRSRSLLPVVSRRLELVAPEEQAAALLAVVRNGFSLSREATARQAARLLGFARPNEQQLKILAAAIDGLLATQRLVENAGILTMP